MLIHDIDTMGTSTDAPMSGSDHRALFYPASDVAARRARMALPPIEPMPTDKSAQPSELSWRAADAVIALIGVATLAAIVFKVLP